jgi:hypothetical protein
MILFSDETLSKTGNKSYPCAHNKGIWHIGDTAPQILNLGNTWHNSLVSCFTCEDRIPTTLYIRGCVESTVGLNALAKRKSPSSAVNRTIHRLPTPQPRHYNN